MLASPAFRRPAHSNPAGPVGRHVDILTQQKLVRLFRIEKDRDLELFLLITRPVNRGPDIEANLIRHRRRRYQRQTYRRLPVGQRPAQAAASRRQGIDRLAPRRTYSRASPLRPNVRIVARNRSQFILRLTPSLRGHHLAASSAAAGSGLVAVFLKTVPMIRFSCQRSILQFGNACWSFLTPASVTFV